MIRLSVNLNKIALLRNSRHSGVPELLSFARAAYAAGAHGITIHPRPDERHIRTTDLKDLAATIEPWRPDFEFNVEGRPDDRFLELVETVTPEQCTLVPDLPSSFTSDKGWELSADEVGFVRSIVQRLHSLGCRVILFVDPDPAVVPRVHQTDADGVEIYTGSYATAYRSGNYAVHLAACSETARLAGNAALRVNMGHDLNLRNLPPLIQAAPEFGRSVNRSRTDRRRADDWI